MPDERFVTDFKVVEAITSPESTYQFEQAVKELLKKGWDIECSGSEVMPSDGNAHPSSMNVLRWAHMVMRATPPPRGMFKVG